MSSTHLNESTADCDAIRDLIPDYAFGLTSPEETRLVEANLSRCPEATAQLADYQHLQDDLRAGVPQVEPPVRLAANLMAAVAESESARPMAKPRRLHPGWLVAAAAAVLLVVTNAYWLLRLNSESQAVADLPGDGMFVLTNESNVRTARLINEDRVGVWALMMWNAQSQIGLLYARGFTPASPDTTFQLWLTRDGERVSAGTFRVDDEGNGVLVFHLDDAIDEFSWARITGGTSQNGDSAPETVVGGEL